MQNLKEHQVEGYLANCLLLVAIISLTACSPPQPSSDSQSATPTVRRKIEKLSTIPSIDADLLPTIDVVPLSPSLATLFSTAHS
ncbi:MAG: hypothetical protein ACI9HK_001988 [Pirellulaceae bacterium]|jgi:hypothetical protein